MQWLLILLTLMIYHLQVYKKQLILKNIIYDDCEQIYDLIEVSTGDIVYSADDINDLVQEINKRLREN